VCVEGNQRCESGRGIPQVCQHGRWMESRLGKELVTWNEDLIVQTTLTAIAGVIMLLLCALTAMGCVKLTSSGSDGGHMKYASPPNTVRSHPLFPCCCTLRLLMYPLLF